MQMQMVLEMGRRESSRERVLERLQQGPALNTELNGICFRYGGRIHELRQTGFIILKEHVEGGVYRYTLTS